MALDFNSILHKDIEKLRKNLWCGREFGRVAVMIGAGFSRNAKKKSAQVPDFPLWRDLAKELYKAIPVGKRKSTFGDSAEDVPKLATQYETIFDRKKLHSLIKKVIPDKKYIPGKLHKMLLSLPWSEILTTNYDTLLERTQQFIYDKKYEVVTRQKNIALSTKPRIVKLHGSFPSDYPFIITEEDYNTYREKFAALVNLAQESLMESILCLIGFSGDDPNFIKWTEWVNSNLGDSAPSIYLCGVLGLTKEERKNLKKKKVLSIDLSPLFPRSEWPEKNERNSKALEWFFLTLKEGEPPDKLTWPTPELSKGKIFKPSNNLPQIPPGPSPFSNLGNMTPQQNPFNIEIFEGILERWQTKREEYPGWLVAPKHNRNIIWNYTKFWTDYILSNISKLPPPVDLKMMFELNWRLEISLTPLFISNIDDELARIVNLYNPFPNEINLEDAKIKPNVKKYEDLEWESIRDKWMQLAFSVIRKAREDDNNKIFHQWIKNLEKVVSLNEKWEARWFYEKSLFYLFRLNLEETAKVLEDWPNFANLPFWMVKYASILAEIGQLDKAKAIAQNMLEKIRVKLEPYDPKYELLSQEGWTMLLLKTIGQNEELESLTRGRGFGKSSTFRERWERLRLFHCNPWLEIELLASDIKETNTKDYLSNQEINNLRNAFSFLRIFEEGALPFRSGIVSMFSESVVKATEKIKFNAPFWAISARVRTGSNRDFEKWFDGFFEQTLNKKKKAFLPEFINILRQAIDRLPQDIKKPTFIGSSLSQRLILLISKLLSRVCYCFSKDQKKLLLELAIDMYRNPIFRGCQQFHDSVNVLFEGVLNSISETNILSKMPELLSLPIPNDKDFIVASPPLWKEPFTYINWSEKPKFKGSISNETISHLLELTRKGSPEERKRASLRLVKIYEIKGLNKSEEKAFSQALWSRVDSQKGLPADTVLLDSSFLLIPEKNNGGAKKKLRNHLVSKDFPKVLNRIKGPNGKITYRMYFSYALPNHLRTLFSSTVPLFLKDKKTRNKLIDWTPEEVVLLLKKIAEFWDEQKVICYGIKNEGYLKNFEEGFKQIGNIIDIFPLIILPRLKKDLDKGTKQLIKRILSEMEQAGFSILSALLIRFLVSENSYDDILYSTSHGLNSTEENIVSQAILGIYYWLIYGERNIIPSAPQKLIIEFFHKIANRSQPALDLAITKASEIVENLPGQLKQEHVNSLLSALDYLIEDTEFHDFGVERGLGTYCSKIPVTKRLEYRRLSVNLAKVVFKYLDAKGEKIPEQILKWKEVWESEFVLNGSDD